MENFSIYETDSDDNETMKQQDSWSKIKSPEYWIKEEVSKSNEANPEFQPVGMDSPLIFNKDWSLPWKVEKSEDGPFIFGSNSNTVPQFTIGVSTSNVNKEASLVERNNAHREDSPFIFGRASKPCKLETETCTRSSNTDTPFFPEIGFYQPSTDQTREAYQALLSIIESNARVQSSFIVRCVVAEEILSILKEKLDNPVFKRAQIEKILIPISNTTFNQLLSISQIIADHPNLTRAGLSYYPTSEKMWEYYKALLDVVKSEMDQMPFESLCMVANDILSILKDGNLSHYYKMANVRRHMGCISHSSFSLLVSFADCITDFEDNKVAVAAVDEEILTDEIPCPEVNNIISIFDHDDGVDSDEDEEMDCSDEDDQMETHEADQESDEDVDWEIVHHPDSE